MNKTRTKKGVPLLLIVLLTIGAFAVGAVLFDLFVSGPTKGVYQTLTDVRGLKAQLIQAGGATAYSDPMDSTTLATQWNGVGDLIELEYNCAILIIHYYDLPTEDLTLTINVYEAGTDQSVEYDGSWTYTARFAEFKYPAPDQLGVFYPSVEVGDGYTGQEPWVITHEQIEHLVYDPDRTETIPDDFNALILSFDLGTGGTSGIEYIIGWDNDPHSPGEDAFADVVVTLSVEDGTPA